MTTDITKLAQRMKAAAVRAKAATEDYVANRMSITVCLEECKEFNDLSDGPDNILALVEVLEKAQRRIADLESRTVTVKLPDYRDTYKFPFADEVEHQVRLALELFSSAAGVKVEAE